jgi:hypothetical protein
MRDQIKELKRALDGSQPAKETKAVSHRTAKKRRGTGTGESVRQPLTAAIRITTFPAMNSDPRFEMIAALGAASPHPSLGDNAKLFDRFVGTWDVDCVFHAADGNETRFAGEWIFGWILDGRVMQDVLSGYPKGRSSPSPEDRRCGTSLRFYDAKTQQWNVTWLGSSNGFLLTLKGGGGGDRIVLQGDDVDGSLLRWSFNDILTNSFVWRGETSSDRGKSWRLEQEMFLTRRAGTTGRPSARPAL